MSVAFLSGWSPGDRTPFPYDAVIREYRQAGKHFVPERVTRGLARVKDALGDPLSVDADQVLLRDFLHTALDKVGNYYDYRTYLGLALLPMCSLEDPRDIVRFARARRDRLVAHLIGDLLGFELAVLARRCDELPEMRPGRPVVEKRCRVAVRFMRPVLARLGLGSTEIGPDHLGAARHLTAVIEPELSTLDRRILKLSMLPVYVCHDEYLFIRVLQLFEATFALLAVQLRAAVQATANGDLLRAADHVSVSEEALQESAPLFSLLGTMQRDAFRTFRAYTEGASAIQSRSYKTIEALCRQPEHNRLRSVAFSSVPEVQQRVLAGTVSLDEALVSARSSRASPPEHLRLLEGAMERFSTTLLRWRRSHYRLAVAMLGQRTGTGYTEGTPYLESVQSIPVFPSVDPSRAGAPTDGR